jgi:hypothetical protein
MRDRVSQRLGCGNLQEFRRWQLPALAQDSYFPSPPRSKARSNRKQFLNSAFAFSTPLFDAFYSRDPVSTPLESALIRFVRQISGGGDENNAFLIGFEKSPMVGHL